jgi:S-formylglutathione hydrolase FrmB
MAILQVNLYSHSLNRRVPISAVLPVGVSPSVGAEDAPPPYKTLYLLHGICGNHMDWIVNSRIARLAESSGLAVIMPSADNSFYTDNANACAMYGDFFGRELVESTRRLFRLSDKREDTYIAGLSMGGYGAIRTGLRYPQTFGAVAGLSSALITEDAVTATNDTPGILGRRSYYETVFGDLDNLINSDNDPKNLISTLKSSGAEIPHMYMCCGTEDFLIEQNRDFHAFLEENGVAHTYVENAGGHTWDYWDEHIVNVLAWLRGK